MNISTFKKILIVTGVVSMVVVVFFVYTLAGLRSDPITFADPPAFVEQYAAEMEHSVSSFQSTEPETDGGDASEAELPALTNDFFNEAALVRNVIMNGEAPDELLRLFSHPEKEKRVKIALALAAVNVSLTHDEASGFPEKRSQFWVDVEEHLPDIQNALFEALITSAKERASSRIPYTLAWMPGQDNKTVEVLAWAAKHHPDSWVRRFSVFFVVRFGGIEELSVPLLSNRTNDPSYNVRKEVLDQRYRRLTQMLWPEEQS